MSRCKAVSSSCGDRRTFASYHEYQLLNVEAHALIVGSVQPYVPAAGTEVRTTR